ncbi:DUF4468 domain-containing protein [Mucilaginibacter boryungensis]|uniref:DUF4468 domain-containing protein n=1 Tax=Mucilaginibacter boryungensis TaxID=768480 RepID=A0ABR9XG60_9SPHI|nr:DUF4468 domain-containing protein [Mucilaginibacter boryungensis]MBE9666256.1 DUF4468 domain-containing protein [Mucilaginibacter boryungensis]
MKNIFLILACCFLVKTSIAQTGQLTLDERNKYIFYQVVDKPAVSADTLFNRCLAGYRSRYLKSFSKIAVVGKQSITIKSAFIVYSNAGLTKHEDGDMAYVMNIEFKEGKYRYWLTDFVYYPYQRNRYGVSERSPGVEVPLERLKDKAGTKTFDNYADQIVKLGIKEGEEIALYLATPQKKTTTTPKINTRNW